MAVGMGRGLLGACLPDGGLMECGNMRKRDNKGMSVTTSKYVPQLYQHLA